MPLFIPMNQGLTKSQKIIISFAIVIVVGIVGYFISQMANSDQEASLYETTILATPNIHEWKWVGSKRKGNCFYRWIDENGVWSEQEISSIKRAKDCRDQIAPTPINNTIPIDETSTTSESSLQLQQTQTMTQ